MKRRNPADPKTQEPDDLTAEWPDNPVSVPNDPLESLVAALPNPCAEIVIRFNAAETMEYAMRELEAFAEANFREFQHPDELEAFQDALQDKVKELMSGVLAGVNNEMMKAAAGTLKSIIPFIKCKIVREFDRPFDLSLHMKLSAVVKNWVSKAAAPFAMNDKEPSLFRNIDALRSFYQLTWDKLEDLSGVDRATLLRWKKPNHNPREETVEKVALAFEEVARQKITAADLRSSDFLERLAAAKNRYKI